jgi:hypothetical protein
MSKKKLIKRTRAQAAEEDRINISSDSEKSSTTEGQRVKKKQRALSPAGTRRRVRTKQAAGRARRKTTTAEPLISLSGMQNVLAMEDQ